MDTFPNIHFQNDLSIAQVSFEKSYFLPLCCSISFTLKGHIKWVCLFISFENVCQAANYSQPPVIRQKVSKSATLGFSCKINKKNKNKTKAKKKKCLKFDNSFKHSVAR